MAFKFSKTITTPPTMKVIQLMAIGFYKKSRSKSLSITTKIYTSPRDEYRGRVERRIVLSGKGLSRPPNLFAYTLLPLSRAKSGMDNAPLTFNRIVKGNLLSEEVSASGYFDMDFAKWPRREVYAGNERFYIPEPEIKATLNARGYIKGRGPQSLNGSALETLIHNLTLRFTGRYKIY